MEHDKRKVALVGTGMVGMSYAYAMLNQNTCDELVLIDINRERALGEAMDLNHGLAFAASSMTIYAGEYADCHDADIVVICAGVAQKPGESRPALLKRNAGVFQSIVGPVVESGFNGIFLVATNPVDIMTRITRDISGFPKERVFGTGTTLDSARLRYLIGDYFHISPRSVHAYVMGEHGESEFVPWSHAFIATKPVLELCAESNGQCNFTHLLNIADQVKHSAQIIINAKQATYYGIGMTLVRITRAIFSDENSVLTVSACLDGEYDETEVYAGVPAIVNRSGVREIYNLELNGEEMEQFRRSCAVLRQYWAEYQSELNTQS